MAVRTAGHVYLFEFSRDTRNITAFETADA